MNSRLIKFDYTFYAPMIAFAVSLVVIVFLMIAYLDSQVIIIKQDTAIRFHIVNNTALMLDYVKLERACGDIVFKGNRHE